jgi:hypothetical protein
MEVENEIKALYTANYKMISEISEDSKVIYASIDTG